MEDLLGLLDPGDEEIEDYIAKRQACAPITVQELIDILEKVKDKKTTMLVNVLTPKDQIDGHEWWTFDVSHIVMKDNKHALVTFNPINFAGS